MVSMELVRAWSTAYQEYIAASDAAAGSADVDSATAWDVAVASSSVAAAWRGIRAKHELPWWISAAVESAAEAFEFQAADWESRARAAREWEAQQGGETASAWFGNPASGSGEAPRPRWLSGSPVVGSGGRPGVRPIPSPTRRRG